MRALLLGLGHLLTGEFRITKGPLSSCGHGFYASQPCRVVTLQHFPDPASHIHLARAGPQAMGTLGKRETCSVGLHSPSEHTRPVWSHPLDAPDRPNGGLHLESAALPVGQWPTCLRP